MKQPPRIAVLGSLHMDIVVRSERQPRLGETLAGRTWQRGPGGKGLNQAVHAARHGASVRMIGRVGDDGFAMPLRTYLAENSVDASSVRTDPEAGTGMSVAIIEDAGDYAAVIVSGVNQRLGADDIAAVTAARADILLLQYEVSPGVLTPAAQAARAKGAMVVFNAAPAAPPPDGLLEAVDLLVVNAIEAEMLTGIPIADLDDATRAVEKLRSAVPAIILTLGPRGFLVGDPDRPPTHRAGHVVTVADTHGAGDAFIGALACRLGNGDDLSAAARYANAAAALMVAAPGTDPRAVSPDRVRALLSIGAA